VGWWWDIVFIVGVIRLRATLFVIIHGHRIDGFEGSAVTTNSLGPGTVARGSDSRKLEKRDGAE
jgi:hypothetical protein